MLVHLYNVDTREFVGSAFADQDPMNPKEYLVPACATTIEPPIVGDREKAIFDISEEMWRIVPDFRRVRFYKKINGSLAEAILLGYKPNLETLTEVPPPSLPKNKAITWDDNEQRWVLIPDLRGQTVFDKASGCAKSVKDVGPISNDLTVLPPPSPDYVWDNDRWVLDTNRVRAKEQLVVKESLKQNDVKTVRAIREWLLTGGSDTKDLKARLEKREQQAIELRQKLKET